jgi:hypothetical protein
MNRAELIPGEFKGEQLLTLAVVGSYRRTLCAVARYTRQLLSMFIGPCQGGADLRVLASLHKLQASIKAAQHSLAELKARVRTRNREDERVWKGVRQGFNKAWRDLQTAFDQANSERT